MEVEECGSALGRACASYLCESLWEFELAVSVPQHPLRQVVRLMLSARQNVRTRRTMRNLDHAMV